MEKEKAIIREFREGDREKIREIFRRTGQRGNPLRVYIEDEELVLWLIVDYYMDYETKLCLVAEFDGKVVGYILGCRDTKQYMKVVLTRILPRMIFRFLWKTATFQYQERKTYLVMRWLLSKSRRELPQPPLDRYPAHAHLHIDQGFRHLQLGPKLVDALAERFQKCGLTGFHGIVMEEEGKNVFARALRMKVLDVRRTTVWDAYTGKRWNAKLLVRDL